MNTCKKCGASLIWVKTESGRAMPCNVTPIRYRERERGDLLLVGETGRVIKAIKDDTSMLKGYVSHFSTCPESVFFRKKNKYTEKNIKQDSIFDNLPERDQSETGNAFFQAKGNRQEQISLF